MLAGCGVIAALLVPAIGSAADSATSTGPATTTGGEAPNQPPRALLYAPNPAMVGQPVPFEAFASSDADGKVVRYEWDFDGDGTYETDGKDSAAAKHAYEKPGTYSVGLRVTDDKGATAEGTMSLEVQPAPEVTPPAQAPSENAGPADGEPDAGASPDSAGADARSDASSGDEGSLKAFPEVIGSHSASHESRSKSNRDSSSSRGDDPSSTPDDSAVAARESTTTATTTPAAGDGSLAARAAATTSVTISDFRFGPASITVNVGDTVRWTNDGPTGHSATSSSGGFDTGILAKGASGSATFDTAGTYSYICTPHPFMKGTVRVVAAGSGGSSGSSGASGSAASSGSSDSSGSASGSGSGSGATDTGTAATDSGGNLPNTGTNTLLVAAIGLALVGAGVAMRMVAGLVGRRAA